MLREAPGALWKRSDQEGGATAARYLRRGGSCIVFRKQGSKNSYAKNWEGAREKCNYGRREKKETAGRSEGEEGARKHAPLPSFLPSTTPCPEARPSSLAAASKKKACFFGKGEHTLMQRHGRSHEREEELHISVAQQPSQGQRRRRRRSKTVPCRDEDVRTVPPVRPQEVRGLMPS